MEFEIGRLVVVRDWDEMAEEYGVYLSSYYSEAIPLPDGLPFLKGMKFLCGIVAEVTGFRVLFDGTQEILLSGIPGFFHISKYVLKPFHSSKPEFSYDDFTAMISGGGMYGD